ncbi:MAG: hypothetical protein JW904_04950 [Spirochaetales bacterium]|nr:hypothetical protein [Spirochaetales bacterium]
MKNKNPRFPNKLLFLGISLMLVGILFLIWTLGLIELNTVWFTIIWIPVIVIGLVMLYFVYIRKKSAQLILPGMILALAGMFFLLFNTIIPEKNISIIWPAFMDIAGLSLIPYAFRRKRKTRIGFLISSGTLIGLSIVFFLFSLKIIDMDFAEVAVRWWPIVLVCVGIIVTTIYMIYKRPAKQTRPASEKPEQ